MASAYVPGTGIEIAAPSVSGWREATVQSVSPDGASLTIELSPLEPPAVGGGTVVCKLTEVRPRPPPPPADYVAGLDEESVVEACGPDGIWQAAAFRAAKMLRSDGGARKLQCTVKMLAVGEETVLDEKYLRPLLEWSAGEWKPARPSAALAHKPTGAAPMAVDDAPPPPPAPPADPAAPITFPPPVLTVLHPVAVGDAMEVTSLEEGLIGSWYAVTVTKLGTAADAGKDPAADDGQYALVEYEADGDAAAETEWVSCLRLRPTPPPPPAVPTATAWTRRLTSKDTVELSYEQGWWEVQFLGRSGATLRVFAQRYGKVHEVHATSLRPGWQAPEPGVWKFPLGGVLKTPDEWAPVIAAKAGGGKGRSSADGGGGGLGLPEMPVGEPATAFKWGHAVEVQSDAEGLKGCWVPGEVLKVDDDAASVTVSWHAAETEPSTAAAPMASTRPAAPPVPAGWAAYLRPGEEVDLFHDGAWWAVFLESRKGGRAKVVEGPDDPLPRDVKVSQLRPRFSWLGWSGGWKYSADGRDVHLPPGPAPLSHNFPNEAAAGGQSSKGRAVRKPKKHGAGADGGRAGASLVPLVDPERVPKLGEYLEVEVEEPEEEGGGVAWKTALVTSILERQRFVAMVNGDDDFMEEYGMEDEGKEWRKVPPDDLARVRAENEAAKVRYQEKVREEQEAEAAAIAAAAEAPPPPPAAAVATATATRPPPPRRTRSARAAPASARRRASVSGWRWRSRATTRASRGRGTRRRCSPPRRRAAAASSSMTRSTRRRPPARPSGWRPPRRSCAPTSCARSRPRAPTTGRRS